MTRQRLVLASQSPARLATLRSAGVEPEVVVSGVDESVVEAVSPAALAATLATMKSRAVHERLLAGEPDPDRLMVLGCDSVLEIDGGIYGKPHDAATARERWRLMRGRKGILHSGHCLSVGPHGREVVRAVDTVVHFADVSDAEIDAYVATGEPLAVAGAFTIDGLGGAFVKGVEGDPHNVVGLSLPTLREMLAEVGVAWTDLWDPQPGSR